MLHSTVFNTAQICHQLGVRHAVMSPGSRNAPLTISFARHPEIKKWIIPDERSAGFIALGIAQETTSPVVLCCTSGTALLNYAPAIAEAYYREIPLLVLSADRPPALIDQRDGQTIRQFEALKNHVKGSDQLPLVNTEADTFEYIEKLTNNINKSLTKPKGPIHINIPFEEPFYPEETEELSYQKFEITESIHDPMGSPILDVSGFSRVLLLIGQQPLDVELNKIIETVSQHIPILKFPLNNLAHGIEHADLFVHDQEELKPELLITSGLSVLSKKMKLFLRANKPTKHLHFDEAGVAVDTFQSEPELVIGSLKQFLASFSLEYLNAEYLTAWQAYESNTKKAVTSFLQNAPFSETVAAHTILKSIPDDSQLHLSNSMPVRYADMFGSRQHVINFSNRGTSGIDGCTSTALGTALVSKKLNVLITGDLAFLYDRNAFFHNHEANNLRIIVLNNQGGGIFRLIDGPSKLPELETYFETRHNRTAEYICKESDLDYLVVNNPNDLNDQLNELYKPSQKAKVLEVFTEPEINQHVYKELKKHINE